MKDNGYRSFHMMFGDLDHEDLDQCFSTAGPRPGAGPWHQLYRAARDYPGIYN